MRDTVWDGVMYTEDMRAGLEAEKEMLPNPTNTSLYSMGLLVDMVSHSHLFPLFVL